MAAEPEPQGAHKPTIEQLGINRSFSPATVVSLPPSTSTSTSATPKIPGPSQLSVLNVGAAPFVFKPTAFNSGATAAEKTLANVETENLEVSLERLKFIESNIPGRTLSHVLLSMWKGNDAMVLPATRAMKLLSRSGAVDFPQRSFKLWEYLLKALTKVPCRELG